MNTSLPLSERIAGQKIKSFARRADVSTVVLALPQPGGADIGRARKALRETKKLREHNPL